MRSLRFVPYHELAGAPNVIVDGAPAEGTVLTLSHWPHTPVPAGFEADLSAEMALRFVASPSRSVNAEAVSNNHFDQDGLVSVFAFVDPGAALARERRLLDVAAAGDFATYRERAAARASMVIAAFADRSRSPLGGTSSDSYDEWSAALYGELLGRLPELCDHPERFRELWAEEDATLDESERLIRTGAVSFDAVQALDLAVVTVPQDAPERGGHRFGGEWAGGLHPMAVYNATDRFAVLSMRGRAYEFLYRYESWVQYRTRRPRPRVDLGPLAEELSADEPGGARWKFDGAGALTPRLHLEGAEASAIAPEDFRLRLEHALGHATPVWDPYAA